MKTTITSTSTTRVDDLRTDLAELDSVLRLAVIEAQRIFREGSYGTRLPGLVITDDEPEQLLSRGLGDVLFASGPRAAEFGWRTRRLTHTAEVCGLTPFDVAVLLLATAPEIDLRYERIYAYLQDDVTRPRPTVALALDLFAPDADTKLTLRRRFLRHAPLQRLGLIELVAEVDPPPPLLGHGLRATSGVVRFLCGDEAIDVALVESCRLDEPAASDGVETAIFDRAFSDRLRTLGSNLDDLDPSPVIVVEGGDRIERNAAARILASAARRPVLTAELGALLSQADPRWGRRLRLAALLHNAVIHLTGTAGDCTLEELEPLCDGSVPVVAGAAALPLGRGAAAPLRVTLPKADFARRRAMWRTALVSSAREASADPDLDGILAARFRLSPVAVTEVMAAAGGLARWRSTAKPDDPAPVASVEELMEAARAVTRGQLDGLARRIAPRRGRSHLILPPDRLGLLDAIRTHVEFGPLVDEQWGFGRVRGSGGGIVALFSGPPGTGKTLAAEVLARELALDLYAVDLSQVVSKYIGETEKNLARVFDAAEGSNAMLFFDEADALFGKRSEVRDAHDRYANIEVSYLLQRMEEYSGLAVLASNLQRNIDEAFLRRVRFVVSFPLPDAESRRRIWEATWPAEAPSSGLDWGDLATRFDVSGATIRDAALAAAFLAAADGGVVSRSHVEEAMRREYAKLGRMPAELGARAALPSTAGAQTGNGAA